MWLNEGFWVEETVQDYVTESNQTQASLEAEDATLLGLVEKYGVGKSQM